MSEARENVCLSACSAACCKDIVINFKNEEEFKLIALPGTKITEDPPSMSRYDRLTRKGKIPDGI
jgi:hypothetical protein